VTEFFEDLPVMSLLAYYDLKNLVVVPISRIEFNNAENNLPILFMNFSV
jgi:hypothetical protein